MRLNTQTICLLVLATLALSACGGGGSGGASNGDPSTSGNNSPPMAEAGTHQNITVGSTVILDGSGSADADGDMLTYRWTITAKPSGSSAQLKDVATATPSFTTDAAGTYIVALAVNDGAVDSAPDTVQIVASVGNSAPVADAGRNQNVATGDSVTLGGSASTDANGDILSYRWSFVSRPAGSAASLNNPNSVSPSFAADMAGNYVVEVVVNDGSADSAPSRVTVTATTANVAPIASAGANQNIKTGILVFLDGTGSSDPEGSRLTYRWSFVSIPASSTTSLTNIATKMPAFTPDVDGNYVVELRVKDEDGASNTDRVTITAKTTNSAPVADAGPNQAVFTGVAVTLGGSASSDADGDMLNYHWTITTKPSGSNATLTLANTVSPVLSTDVDGDYVIGLVVNDGAIDSASDQVTISVQPARIVNHYDNATLFIVRTANKVQPAEPVASLAEYEAVYGRIPGVDYGVLAATLFFANGGQHLYAIDPGGTSVSDFQQALASSSGLPVSLVALPGAACCISDPVALSAVMKALTAHVANSPNRFALIAAPKNSGYSELLTFRRNFNSRHAALYAPWLIVDDSSAAGGRRALPPSAAVAGVIQRNDMNRGVFDVPAGPDAAFSGALTPALERDLASVSGDLTTHNINELRHSAATGFFPAIWGARVLSGDPDPYISRFRYLRHVSYSIHTSLRQYFDSIAPNFEPTVITINAMIEDYFNRQWRRGALVGSTPQSAYFSRCTLVMPNLQCQVGIAIERPAEFDVTTIQLVIP